MQVKYINPFSNQSQLFSKKFDNATDEGDSEKLKLLIDDALNIINKENIASQAQLYYSIGTVYGDIARIENTNDESCIEKQLFYFRKSLELINSIELSDEKYIPYINGFKLNLYTNYGNTLDHCGRKIAAIEQYQKAIRIKRDFGMALGNLGMTYRHYAMMVSDSVHRDYMNHFAYSLLCKAIDSNDKSVHKNAYDYFSKAINSYTEEYIQAVLVPSLKIPQYNYENEEELKYRKWALENKLFINPLNDLPVNEYCFAADVLQLPNMIVNINDKPIFHGMFNQIKQDYIFARYQFYYGIQQNTETHFADKDTYLLNFSDYPQYSIRVEMLKSSFRTLYSLLDKCAYFLNYYFDLGIEEHKITFHKVWANTKIVSLCKQNNNYALNALRWIGKDFYNKLLDSPNPYAKKTCTIRNALEHKYTKIYWDLFHDRTNGEIDNLAFYISEAELIDETMKLLHIIRETIISMVLTVGIEEKERNKTNTKIAIPFTFDQYDDEWKL